MRVGDNVRIRRQRWSVLAIRPCADCQLVTVGGRDVANVGATRHFLLPFDDVEVADLRPRVRVVGMRRWAHALRAQVDRNGPADKLWTAVRAHFELLPYQLEPALAIVRGLGCRLLIADAVGLGKTIQAGLVASELLARGAAERVLVLTPAGLREQWAHELSTRFALQAQVVDMASARRLAAELPAGVNPWSAIPIAVASFDYVKRPEVAPAVAAARWDAVIVDEAHGVTPGSDRYATVEALCGLTPYVILLTATPHNGNGAAFEALCRLGSRGDGPLIVMRRSRKDVGLVADRRIHRLYVRPSDAEQRMHDALAALGRRIAASGTFEQDSLLALTVLNKRALSSARSLEQSAVRLASSISAGADDVWQLALPLDDASGDLDARDRAPEYALAVFGGDAAVRRDVDSLADLAREAVAKETKLIRLRRLLRHIRRLGESAIVFTEYRDTLVHLRAALGADVAILHGGLPSHERRAELARFTSGGAPILLATDAAGEGLNLHHTCRVVINLELPWSPTRVEQRIGRVDRLGQKRRVHVFHLIARDTAEMRLLDYLRQKVARARQDIVIDDPLGWFDDESPDEGLEAISWLMARSC